jgi:hypothetical protein
MILLYEGEEGKKRGERERGKWNGRRKKKGGKFKFCNTMYRACM